MSIIKNDEESHKGLVLEIIPFAHSFNDGYDYCSDAIVWNLLTNAPSSVTYYSSMPGSTGNGKAEVDALPAIRAAYEVWKYERERQYVINEYAYTYRPFVGDTVKVVAGRKAPIGTVGEVIEVKETQYGLRFVIDDGRIRHVAWSGKVEVIARPITAKPKHLKPFKPMPDMGAIRILFGIK